MRYERIKVVGEGEGWAGKEGFLYSSDVLQTSEARDRSHHQLDSLHAGGTSSRGARANEIIRFETPCNDINELRQPVIP